MKNIILTTALLSISGSLMATQSVTTPSFAEQLQMQQKQLHPQEFNFFSDRYKQVTAHKNIDNSQLAVFSEQKPSFKEQLDGQMQQLKGHKFHPASDVYYQIISR